MLVLGFAVVFLARVLGILYVINNVNDEDIRSRGSVRLIGAAVPFVVLFVAYLIHVLLKDGFAVDDLGRIYMEPYKYLNNFIDMWYLTIVLLIGVVLVLFGIGKTILSKTYIGGIWPAGIGTVLTVLALLLCSAWNNTAYSPTSSTPGAPSMPKSSTKKNSKPITHTNTRKPPCRSERAGDLFL